MTHTDITSLPEGMYCFFCHSPELVKHETPESLTYTCENCGKTDARTVVIDPALAFEMTSDGPAHSTVGALLYRETDQTFLLMKKKTYPPVIDVIAGHLDKGESPETAVSREVKEETNLTITSQKKIWEGMVKNRFCRRGISNHYWYLYLCTYEGKPIIDTEEIVYLKSYTLEEMKAESTFNPSIKPIIDSLNVHLLSPTNR